MNPNRIEAIVLLLFCGTVLFTVALFLSNLMFPMDGQMFQVIAGLATGFAGAVLARVKPGKLDTPDDATTTTTTTTVSAAPPAATVTKVEEVK